MCGRFAQKTKPKKLSKKFQVKVPDALIEWDSKYNVAPSSIVPIFRVPSKGNQPIMETFKWGLVPAGSKDPTIGFKLVNARAETVAEKYSFRDSFRERRCLVPVDGYYEWAQDTKPKQPHYFFMKDGEPFCLAAIWDFWEPSDKKETSLYTFSLITTEPNSMAALVHDRMPVIIAEKDFGTWLAPDNHDIEGLKKLLKPFDPAVMDSYPVSPFVSNARNEGPECIEKVEPLKNKLKTKPPDNQQGFDFSV